MIDKILFFDDWLLIQANSLVGHSLWVDKIILYLSVGLVYVAPLILLGLWFYSRYAKQPTLQILFSAILPWQVFNRIIAKFVWYRERPFVNDNIEVKELFFHRPDHSFPSDHMTFFAALTVASFLAGYPKLGWFFLVTGLIVGTSRVIIGVHYPLDIIGGVIIGTFGAFVIYWLRAPLTKFVYEPLIKIARKIRLA
ncbi:phosphatase PAP2 family protein [Patescibacteria group bacterium]|nr:phosphatase PAP2 family protein [Patescibacteria group bacterium]